MQDANQPDWPSDVFEVLRAQRVRQVCYLPDAGHARLISLCHACTEMRPIVLTTEEEGVAVLLGGWLGGDRGVLLMQSSGVGNCVNMLGLARTMRYPLLMLVTMRGDFGESNPWQLPMGQAAGTVLQAMGSIVFSAERPAEVGQVVEAAAGMAFSGNQAVAVLLRQRLIGAKRFEAAR
ncbi:MAG: phosphonopyruvate decarboxylase [Alphaproteobacteria bacterium]|nr:phosphonopyruvate decarboxylase [Alphaproteobacteria bacterium]